MTEADDIDDLDVGDAATPFPEGVVRLSTADNPSRADVDT